MKRTTTVFAALILGAASAPALAGSFEEATRAFLAAHPGAELVADESAARWSLIYGFATEPAAGDPADVARAFVAGHADLLGLGGDGSGEILDRVAAHRSRRYVRFQQTHLGRPVFDAAVIVGVDGAGRVFQVSSTAVASPSWRGEPPLDGPAAVAAAAGGIAGLGEPRDVTLGGLALGDASAPAWRVVAPGAGLHLWLTYVDAWSGAVLWREDLVRRHDALVFAENPVVDEGQTTQVFLPNIVQEGEHVNHTYGAFARTGTCTATDSYGMCTAWTHDAVADGNGFLDTLPLLSDPTAEPDGFAEVNAYYHLDMQNTWMRDEFGYDGLYLDPESNTEETHLWAYTSLDWANAAYAGGWDSPDSIIFGQGNLYGDVVDFAYDTDVILHEFTHSVSGKAFNIRFGSRDEWGFNSTPGGVEEGTADYFALTRTGNPALAEYALGIYGRNADNDHVCPDDLEGEGHYDGEIVGGALWDLRNALGAARTDHLQYGALLGVTIRSFDDWAAALLAQAETMKQETDPDLVFDDADVAALQAVIDGRGLVGCLRAVWLWEDDAPIVKLHYCAWDMTQGQGTPSAIQYVTPTFEDTRTLKLLITPAGDRNYDVLVRKGEPVTFTWSEGGYPYSWEAEYDFEWTGTAADPLTEVKISEITEYELEPGTDYYFSIICRPNMNGCQSSVTMSLSTEPDVEEDAGPDGDTDADTDADTDTGTDADAGPTGTGDSGCGCRAASARGASLLSSLLSLVR